MPRAEAAEGAGRYWCHPCNQPQPGPVIVPLLLTLIVVPVQLGVIVAFVLLLADGLFGLPFPGKEVP